MFLSVIGWAVINAGAGAANLAGFAIGSALMVCVYITGGHSGGHREIPPLIRAFVTPL